MGPRREIAEAADQCFFKLYERLILYTQYIRLTVLMPFFDTTSCLHSRFDTRENLMFSFLDFKMDLDLVKTFMTKIHVYFHFYISVMPPATWHCQSCHRYSSSFMHFLQTSGKPWLKF